MSSGIRVGARERLAIEAVLEEPVDRAWVNGRFCLWVRGVSLGDLNDVAMLLGVANWWRSFVKDENPRWDEQLVDLPAAQAFDLLHLSAFRAYPPAPISDGFRFFIGHLGMSAWDAYDVVLVDDPVGRQRLLWRLRDGPVHEATFEPRALQDIGREFLAAWTAAGLPLERSVK